MLKYWADWGPIFPSKCYYPAHANNWAGTAALISHQQWASHSLARWTKWQRRTCRPHACTLRSFRYKRHTPQHLSNMLSSSGKAIIPVTMWPIPELELSHIKPTPQHRTKSALCAPEPHTETWSHGHEAMERQIADAFGQREHQRSLIHNSLHYSTQKIRKRVVLFTDSCDYWAVSQITAVIVQWGESCRIQWRPRSPWPSSELHTTHLVLAGECC